MQQPLKEVGASLVAHAKATTTEDPRERALDHPTVPAQPLGRVDPPAGDPWSDAASTETTSEGREIIALSACSLAGRFRGGRVCLVAR